MFSTVAILGVGLIGGSLGLEIKKKRLAKTVIGHGRTRANLNVALKRKLIDRATLTISDAVADADLILICTPIQTLISQLKEIAQFAKPGALIMDVGSTKSQVVAAAERVLPAHVYFIGAHPMAGTENSGAKAALADLFLKKKCLLTPTRKTPAKVLQKAKTFWKKIGSEVLIYSPSDHDTVLALLSHLPQMAAYSLMNSIGTVLNEPEIRTVAGSGLRDTTRLAASPSEVWRDICLTNAHPLAGALKHYKNEIGHLIAWIEKGDANKLTKYFEKSVKLRKKL